MWDPQWIPEASSSAGVNWTAGVIYFQRTRAGVWFWEGRCFSPNAPCSAATELQTWHLCCQLPSQLSPKWHFPCSSSPRIKKLHFHSVFTLHRWQGTFPNHCVEAGARFERCVILLSWGGGKVHAEKHDQPGSSYEFSMHLHSLCPQTCVSDPGKNSTHRSTSSGIPSAYYFLSPNMLLQLCYCCSPAAEFPRMMDFLTLRETVLSTFVVSN